MRKTRVRICSLHEWNERMERGTIHQDCIAELLLPKKFTIYIQRPVYHAVVLLGETMAVVNIREPHSMEIAAKERSVLVLLGKNRAMATHRAAVYAFDEAEVRAEQRARVFAYGEARAELKGEAEGYAGDYASGNCAENAKLWDIGTTASLCSVCMDGESACVCSASLRKKIRYARTRRKAKRMIAACGKP